MITDTQAQQVLSEIKKANNILMHCHRTPDGDSLGSTLGMLHALKGMGKNVTLIKGDSSKPAFLSFLPGFDLIEEKNYTEVDASQYDLFLVLDSGSIDRVSNEGEVVFPETMQTIVIDHHISNPGFGKINIVDATYPATCQMVYDLIKKWNVPITHDIASCLYIGIYTDTGGFKYRNATVETYEAVTELVRAAPDFANMLFTLENSNTKGRIKLQAILLNSVETWYSDSVAIASVSHDTIQKEGISEDDVNGIYIANMLKSVEGWNVAIGVIEKTPGHVGVSMRTRDENTYDVSKLAVNLGGGGHKSASGAIIMGTIDEAKAKIKQVLAETFTFLK